LTLKRLDSIMKLDQKSKVILSTHIRMLRVNRTLLHIKQETKRQRKYNETGNSLPGERDAELSLFKSQSPFQAGVRALGVPPPPPLSHSSWLICAF
jgi:hypothetical protein